MDPNTKAVIRQGYMRKYVQCLYTSFLCDEPFGKNKVGQMKRLIFVRAEPTDIIYAYLIFPMSAV
jgi:hypothetical protein